MVTGLGRTIIGRSALAHATRLLMDYALSVAVGLVIVVMGPVSDAPIHVVVSRSGDLSIARHAMASFCHVINVMPIARGRLTHGKGVFLLNCVTHNLLRNSSAFTRQPASCR